MLAPLLLALTIGQAPPALLTRGPVAVVQTSARPGAESVAPKVSRMVFEALARAGVREPLEPAAANRMLRAAGGADPRSCQGTRACLARLAAVLGPRAVIVGVDVGKVGKTLAIHLEALTADQTTSLGAVDVTAPSANWSASLAGPVGDFSRKVREGLALGVPLAPPSTSASASSSPSLSPSSSTERSANSANSASLGSLASSSSAESSSSTATDETDVPRRAELRPSATVEGTDAVTSAEPARARARVAPWVLTGGAAVAAGGAIALGVSSGLTRQRWNAALVTLPDGTQGTRLSEPESRALAASANTAMALSVSSAILSAALAATASWLFLKE